MTVAQTRLVGTGVALFVAASALVAPVAAGRAQTADAGPCFGIILPSTQLLESDPDSAEGLRVLVTSYLTGPALQTLALDARLASQALEEARLKSCHYVVAATLTQKRRSGRFGRLLGETAGSALWRLPGAASTGAALATAGVQAAASLASSTKSKDEVSFEYRVYTSDGGTLLGPTIERAKADADGQDLVTPLVARAAEAIVAAASSRR